MGAPTLSSASKVCIAYIRQAGKTLPGAVPRAHRMHADVEWAVAIMLRTTSPAVLAHSGTSALSRSIWERDPVVWSSR